AAYVANTTQAYRAALDAALRGDGFTLPPQARLDLEQSFSRGLTPGFLEGVNHQRLVEGRNSKSRGVRVGVVVEASRRGVCVRLAEAPAGVELVKPGDGVVFDEGKPERPEQGGRVYEILAGAEFSRERSERTLELRFGHGDLDPARVPVGAVV